MPARFRPRGAFAVLIVAALVLALGGASFAVPARGGKAQDTVSPIGTYAVGRVTETLVDASRPTPAFGTYAGAPDRTLETAIYYPAAGEYAEDTVVDDAPPAKGDGPYPLIIFTHGVTGNAGVYEGFVTQWVSAGYVVAAPNYPLSHTGAPGGDVFASGISDVSHQPADDSFVLDEVIARSRTKGSPLRGLLDRKHIGASGHSLGGITTFGVTYAECCIDTRVDAATVMSGLAGLVAEPETYFQDVETPLLLLHGDSDPIVPYRGSVDAFSLADGPRYLVTFPGGGHIVPFVGAEGSQGQVLVDSSVAFWDRYLKEDADAVERLRDSVTDPAVATLEEQGRAR